MPRLVLEVAERGLEIGREGAGEAGDVAEEGGAAAVGGGEGSPEVEFVGGTSDWGGGVGIGGGGGRVHGGFCGEQRFRGKTTEVFFPERFRRV